MELQILPTDRVLPVWQFSLGGDLIVPKLSCVLACSNHSKASSFSSLSALFSSSYIISGGFQISIVQ
eukprot:6943261-Ditylum_brightwellii.AAC.1